MHDLSQRPARDSHRSTQVVEHHGNTPSQATLVDKITNQLASRIGTHCYDMWFSDTHFTIDANRLQVAAANSFIARWIESNFTDEIRSACAAAMDGAAEVCVEVTHADLTTRDATTNRRPGDAARSNQARTGKAEGPEQHPTAPPSRRDARSPQQNRLPRMRRIEDFVVSDTNRVAYGAARQLAEARTGTHHSPLFLHGPCGVGKTHLLQGSCRHYAETWGISPSAVRYVTTEQFTNEYITAVRNGRIDEFRRRMRRLELLAIDDVHFLSNKERTQVEFLHTFDEISMSGARVILASDSHPRQLRQLNKALVSRMLSGMIVQIELPDLDLRRRLARKLAADRGLDIAEPALEVIAAECTGSIRELEGAINKLLALRASIAHHGSMNGSANGSANGSPGLNGMALGPQGQIGLVMVQQLFQDHTQTTNSPVRISTIIETVCERLNVTRSELMASGRHKRVVLARSLISHLCKKMTTHSFPEIAAAMGRRNHSTIHNANRRMCEQLEANATVTLDSPEQPIPLAELVNQIKQQVVRKHRD